MSYYDKIIETAILLAVAFEAVISYLTYERMIFTARKRKLARLLAKIGIRS